MDARPFVVLMDASRIQRSIRRMAYSIAETYFSSTGIYIIGINDIGCEIGKILYDQVKSLVPCSCHLGSLSIPNHTQHSPEASSLNPMLIEGATVLLVDDVVFTGKTLQKAVHQILSLSEPKHLSCMALIDRGHRRFPIELTFVGLHWPTKLNEHVQVSWDERSPSSQVLLYYD